LTPIIPLPCASIQSAAIIPVASVVSVTDDNREISLSSNHQCQSPLIVEPVLSHLHSVIPVDDVSVDTAVESSISVGVLRDLPISNPILPLSLPNVQISITERYTVFCQISTLRSKSDIFLNKDEKLFSEYPPYATQLEVLSCL
jgi:hypothetical protein